MRGFSFFVGALLAFTFSIATEARPEQVPTQKPVMPPAASLPALEPLQSVLRSSEAQSEKPPAKLRVREQTLATATHHEPADLAISVMQAFSARREARHLFVQGISARQREALTTLSGKAGKEGFEIRLSRTNGIPTFIRSGDAGLAQAKQKGQAGLTDAAFEFMEKNAAAFRLQSPVNELMLKRTRSGADGKHHYLFQQHVDNVPVRGAQLAMHFDGEGNLYAVSARTAPSLKGFNTKPQFNAEEAALIAVEKLENRDSEVRKVELQIRKISGRYLLVYEVETRTEDVNRWRTIINARNGRLLEHFLDHHGADVSASGADIDGETRHFSAWHQNGLHYLIDITTPAKTFDEDPLNRISHYGDTYLVDFANSSGDTTHYVISNSATSGWNPVAVSALHNAKQSFSYFKNTHGHEGIDGAQGNLFLGIHYGSNYDNAFWSGGWMVFGDGGSVFSNLAACVDIVGHEMAHGVIEATANLIYENQSGALNESFADFFGSMVERRNWYLGEDCTLASPGFLRNMANPHEGLSSQPAHMSEFVYLANTPSTDHGGVHINSGIPNRAAYLLAEGLSQEGIGTSVGLEAAEALYYRTLSTYLVASSQFIDLRRGMLLAADDLYPGNTGIREAIIAAFDAVGIVEGAEGVPNDSTPSGSETLVGDDLLFYYYPADGTYDDFYESANGFEIYMQALDKPFSGYDPSADYYLGNSITPFGARPVAFTDEYGTVMLYVGADGNVYWMDPTGEYQITDDGGTWSIAVSHDGRHVAFTTFYANDNHVHVLDVAKGEIVSHPLHVADYQPDAITSGSRILYADALDFNYLGNKVVFDALVCVATPTADCDSTDAHGFWTIGILNLLDGTMYYPFKGQSVDYHIGFPVFAHNKEHIIAFDGIGRLDNGNYDTGTFIFDVENGNFPGGSGIYRGEYAGGPERWGIPTFSGDDDALIFQHLIGDGSARVSTISLALKANFAFDFGTAYTRMNDWDAGFGTMHRAVHRDYVNAQLTPSQNILDFGDIEIGNGKSLGLTLTNNSQTDIVIYRIEHGNNLFAHNFLNTRIPRGRAVQGTITFLGASTSGSKMDTLRFHSENANEPLEINLTANATKSTGTSDDDGSGDSDDSSGDGGSGGDESGGGGSSAGSSSGGGGGPAPWLLFLLFLAVLIGGARREKPITRC